MVKALEWRCRLTDVLLTIHSVLVCHEIAHTATSWNIHKGHKRPGCGKALWSSLHWGCVLFVYWHHSAQTNPSNLKSWEPHLVPESSQYPVSILGLDGMWHCDTIHFPKTGIGRKQTARCTGHISSRFWSLKILFQIPSAKSPFWPFSSETPSTCLMFSLKIYGIIWHPMDTPFSLHVAPTCTNHQGVDTQWLGRAQQTIAGYNEGILWGYPLVN